MGGTSSSFSHLFLSLHTYLELFRFRLHSWLVVHSNGVPAMQRPLTHFSFPRQFLSLKQFSTCGGPPDIQKPLAHFPFFRQSSLLTHSMILNIYKIRIIKPESKDRTNKYVRAIQHGFSLRFDMHIFFLQRYLLLGFPVDKLVQSLSFLKVVESHSTGV